MEELLWVCVLFSLSDLARCKEKCGWFSKDTSKFTEAFNHLTLTYDLTWTDLQIALSPAAL